MPSMPRPSEVRANSSTQCATLPKVMKHFWPLITKTSRRAPPWSSWTQRRSRMRLGDGDRRQGAALGGKAEKRRFCSSVPKCSTGSAIPIEFWPARMRPSRPWRSRACQTQQRQISARAAIFFRHPELQQAHVAENRTSSSGKRSVSSISAAIGAICLSTILRPDRAKAVCSSVIVVLRSNFVSVDVFRL